jgi:hypothetical protein
VFRPIRDPFDGGIPQGTSQAQLYRRNHGRALGTVAPRRRLGRTLGNAPQTQTSRRVAPVRPQPCRPTNRRPTAPTIQALQPQLLQVHQRNGCTRSSLGPSQINLTSCNEIDAGTSPGTCTGIGVAEDEDQSWEWAPRHLAMTWDPYETVKSYHAEFIPQKDSHAPNAPTQLQSKRVLSHRVPVKQEARP